MENKKDKIQKLLLENYNCSQVSAELSIPYSTVIYVVNKYKLIVLKKKQRLNVNHTYFDVIDKPDKAYILGYFFADGCIQNYKKVKRIRFNSAMDDFQIIEFIRNEISPETKLTIIKDKRENLIINNIKVKNKQDTVSFGVVSEKIVDILVNNFNVSFNKTYSQNKFNFDLIPDEFIKDFIRGYFDGDGSIHGRVDFVSMNHEFLKQIGYILKTKFDIQTNFDILEYRNNIGYLKTTQISDFYNKIYYENCVCLERKKEKFV
jgi:intein/homing endonuclease